MTFEGIAMDLSERGALVPACEGQRHTYCWVRLTDRELRVRCRVCGWYVVLPSDRMAELTVDDQRTVQR